MSQILSQCQILPCVFSEFELESSVLRFFVMGDDWRGIVGGGGLRQDGDWGADMVSDCLADIMPEIG